MDARNGRFCITPEYPSGTYAYFVTINSALAPIFPYTFYGTYYGVVQTGNTLNGGHNTIPGTATQYTTALAPLLAIAASATTICSGTSVTFTPTPTNGGTTPSYQWKKNGVNIATGSSYTTLSLATGDIITCVITSNAYYLTATTATSNSITITVNANVTPSVSINTSTTTICSGTATTFNATPSNGGTTPAYQWKKNGTNIGVNSSAYTDNALANNDAITCVMTSNATCATASTSTSNSVTMTVNTTVTPAVSINTNATTICAGTSVAFNATATNGGTTPTYQWKKNAINVGINSSTYSDNALANNDVISCTMTSNATCKTTSSATSNLLSITTNCPTVTINLKLFIEGYYLGNGMMKAILDPTNYPNTCDSVTVELHNSTTPYSLVYSVNNVISTSGWGSFVFPSSYYNGNYYLAIKCRNGVTIWTKNTYSFSTSLLACDMTH